jgi:hypothetical protein
MKKILKYISYTLAFALFIFAVMKMSDAVYASTVKSAVVVVHPASEINASASVKTLALNNSSTPSVSAEQTKVAKSTTSTKATVKSTAKKSTVKKVVKKPVKKTTKKKKVVKKKKHVNLNPPVITLDTVPHSPKP